MDHEKIKHASVMLSKDVFTGKNHSECIRLLKQDMTQGFITSTGRQVDRYMALSIAIDARQTIHKHHPKDCLLSEDLLDDPYYKYANTP